MSHGLAITRKEGESVMIGSDIRVTLVWIGLKKAQITIKAPKEFVVLREELIKADGDPEPVPNGKPA